MKKKEVKQEEFKEVFIVYCKGCTHIINDLDILYADHLKRKKLCYTKIKVKI